MTSEADRYARVHALLAGVLELERADRGSYLDEACGDDAALRAEVTELLALGLDDGAGAGFADEGIERGRAALESLFDDSTSTWLPEKIGEFTILRQIGQGGMGVVYEAQQESPRRRVAIKLLHPMLTTPQRLHRFRREAEALGRLQHPGIARIFEAGTYDVGRGEQPFFAMELVDGVDVRTHCSRHALDLGGRIELLARVADAVQYAHERGVVHRDLKPDNVLVDPQGQPRVLDFGIAHVSSDTSTLSTLMTVEGQLVGTLGYMAPELLRNDADAGGPQADVYALGVLGFELLVGRPPRDIADLAIPQAIALLSSSEPLRAGTVDTNLRGDVETILGMALASDREHRYATPAALAADLRRYLTHRPILARPPSRTYLIGKFARRNKALVGGVVATLVVAVGGAAVAIHYAIDAAHNADVSDRRADALERANYVARLATANSAIQRQDYVSAAAHLDRSPAVHRGWEYDYLRAQLVQHSDEWETPAPLVGDPVFHEPTGRMVSVLSDASIGAWDISDGRMVRSAPLEAGPGVTPERLLDGKLHGPSLRFALGTDAGIVIGNLQTGELTSSILDSENAAAKPLAWDDAGEKLLWVRGRGETRIWSGTSSRTLSSVSSGLGVFDHAGERVALKGPQSGRVRLLDASTGELLAERLLDDTVVDLAFAPDDGRLAVAGQYRNVYLLDGGTLAVVTRLSGHQDSVYGVAWSTDGSALVTTSADGTARVWSVETLGSSTVYETDLTGSAQARFTPEGAYIVVTGEKVQRFLLQDSSVLRGHASFVYRLCFSDDGSLLASSGYRESEVLVWDVSRGQLSSRHPAPMTCTGPVWSSAPILAFAEEGRGLVAATEVAVVHWDLVTGDALPVSSNPDEQERYFETLGRREGVRGNTNDFAISPEGRWLATGAARSVVDIFSTDDPTTPRGRLVGHVGTVYCVTFSPDGKRIATGGNDGTVRIWDSGTYEQLLVLRGHRQYVMDVQFSPDGFLLASASGDTTIRLWDTKPLHERRAMASAGK